MLEPDYISASSSSLNEENGDKNIVAIVASVISVLVFGFGILAIFLIRKVAKSFRAAPEKPPSPYHNLNSSSETTSMKGSDEMVTFAPSAPIQRPIGKVESDQVFQGNAKVARWSTLVLGEVIGKGTFGIVYKYVTILRC